MSSDDSSGRPRLILGSGSPRRRALLGEAGLEFTVEVSDVDESLAGRPEPEWAAVELACRKALAVARVHRGEAALVLGADTVVAVDEPDGPLLLGKPEDAAEAVDSVVLDLSDLTIPGRLQVDPAGLLTSAAEAHLGPAAGEVATAPFVWSRQSRQLTGAGRAKRVFGKLRFDWRRPQEPAVKAHLRLLRLTPEVRAALVAHHGPPADEPVDDPVDDPTTPADPEEAP